MPLDSGHDRFAGLDPAIRRMCETMLRLEQGFEQTQQIINAAFEAISQHQNTIDAARGGQDQLRADARKLQEAALVMGYDLFKIMEQTRELEVHRETGASMPNVAAAITEEAPEEFSVKNFVLEYLRSKHPRFVYASSIAGKLREMGHAVHPKTVGMTLYRWSQKGMARREGKDKWFFVPESERAQLDALDVLESAEKEPA